MPSRVTLSVSSCRVGRNWKGESCKRTEEVLRKLLNSIGVPPVAGGEVECIRHLGNNRACEYGIRRDCTVENRQ